LNLYDFFVRTETDYKQRTESAFNYENRSARVEFDRIRSQLQQWFDQYPRKGKLDLLSRFKSSDDTQHYSAFFELYCYTLLQKQGFRVDLHTESTARKGKRPDFAAHADNGRSFYLESTVLYDSKEERSFEARRKELYDYLDNNMESPDYFLEIEIVSSSSEALPLRRIRDYLDRKYEKVDYASIVDLYENQEYDELPAWSFVEKGWRIDFTPIPKSKGSRGKENLRPIGVEFTGIQWIDARSPILKSLRAKAKRYGALRRPFLIALNVLSDHYHVPDRIDILDALFGQEVFGYDPRTGTAAPYRKRNGLWTSPDRPIYTRVSGVAIAIQLTSWTIAKTDLLVWHNPWAQHPLDMTIWKGLQNYVDTGTGTMKTRPGLSGFQILDLEDNWPFE
jgi:hypothetical protein